MSAEAAADTTNDLTTPPWRRATVVGPGVLLAVTVGLASAFGSDHYGGPVMLYALLLGMAFNHLSEDGACVAGELLARVLMMMIAFIPMSAFWELGRVVGDDKLKLWFLHGAVGRQ